MLTPEENERLTRVGPGTPGGELLRRYWLPLAAAKELTDETPTKYVRVLGEDLVLFRDKTGRIGLLRDHCSHRGASLLYGRVEERGIACAYHGWLYDCEGNILETPPERNEAIMNSVKHKAYPVQRLVGLIWAYMGPPPAPVIPPYDVWARRDGTHTVHFQPQLDCNWVAAMENSVDPAHNQILHQRLTYPQVLAPGEEEPRIPPSTTRGFIDDIDHYDWYPVPYGGIMKKRVFKNGMVDEHPILFPNILRHGTSTQIRVPIDDTHTMIVFVRFIPSQDGSIVEEDEDSIPVRYQAAYKDPPDALHPFTRFDMNQGQQQDHMAWETQGPITDRTVEHVSYSDQGVLMYRRMLLDNIERVEQGLEPLGVVRDPDHPIIDTNLKQDLEGSRRERIERERRPIEA